MDEKHMKIVCSRSLTISELKPNNNFQTDILKVGAFKGKLYTSYIYFDLDNLPMNAQINYGVLRMYLRNQISRSTSNVLCVYPLKEDFSEMTTFNNQPEYRKEHTKLAISNCASGWIDINVTSMLIRWNENLMDNKGLILQGDKDRNKNSPLSFYSPLVVNYELMPIMCISYKCFKEQSNKKVIDVKEKHWTLDFKQTGISPIINVKNIIQGTFFIENVGENPLLSTIEVSSDSIHWVEDSYKTIDKEETKSLVAKYYGKYYRLRLASTCTGIAKVRFIYQVYR